MVAHELVGDVPLALALGEDAHEAQVLGALGVQQLVGAAAGEQGEDDLRVEGRVEVRLGLLGLREPGLDVGDAGVGDGVPLAVGAAAALYPVDLDEAVLQEAGHGRVDLPVREGAVVAELLVEGALEVVAVARAGLEEA